MSIKGFDFNGVIHKYDYNALDNKPNMDAMIGSPLVAEDVASMTDTSRIYVYTGSETGYTNGNWYYYNGTSWVSGGVYNSVAISDAQIGGAVADWLEDHPEATAVADGSITAQKLASGLLDSSEAWAVGQINGTDVASTDARYHNNSKYYAQQASASATTATAASQASADAAEIRQINTNSISFTEASTRANIESGESLSVMLGKTKKWFTDLGTAAWRSVANNLTTASSGASVLDAYQGKVLNDKISQMKVANYRIYDARSGTVNYAQWNSIGSITIPAGDTHVWLVFAMSNDGIAADHMAAMKIVSTPSTGTTLGEGKFEGKNGALMNAWGFVNPGVDVDRVISPQIYGYQSTAYSAYARIYAIAICDTR